MEIKKKPIIILLSLLALSASLFSYGKSVSAASYNFYDLSNWKTVGYNYTTSGGFVGAVQSMLWASNLKDTVGSVDKSFGPKTYNAVKLFQSKYRLSVDGNVGPATWGKFEDMTYNLDWGTRRYRGGSSYYEVTFLSTASGAGTSYMYYLDKYNHPGETYTSGTIWVDNPYTFSVPEVSGEVKINQENKSIETGFERIAKVPIINIKSEIHIPFNLNEKVYELKGKPEVVAETRGESCAIVSWYETNGDPIMTSQSINHLKDVQSLLNGVKNIWYQGKVTKEVKIKGQVAIVEKTKHGHDSLHVITHDHIYTIAGAKEDVLFKIANHIDYK